MANAKSTALQTTPASLPGAALAQFTRLAYPPKNMRLPKKDSPRRPFDGVTQLMPNTLAPEEIIKVLPALQLPEESAVRGL